MTFEEWWNTKDYPARCKENCMEAFNAGLKSGEEKAKKEIEEDFLNCYRGYPEKRGGIND